MSDKDLYRDISVAQSRNGTGTLQSGVDFSFLSSAAKLYLTGIRSIQNDSFYQPCMSLAR